MNNDKPSSDSSHSPTEQPGDASCFSEELTASDRDRFRDFVMLHMEMGMQSNPASFARHALEWATKYERAKQAERSEQAIESIRYRDDIIKNLEAKQAELLAERDREKADAEKWYKKYNEMSEIAFKSANKASDQSAEIERLKSQLKDYCNDCQHPTVNERQAAELSKLRQENEAKRSDLTDKLEEAVHHMDNGHTAQATTLIYEVIGELEPKGE